MSLEDPSGSRPSSTAPEALEPWPYRELLDELRNLLVRQGHLGLLLLDVSHSSGIELVRNIDASFIRREISRALRGFADKMESTIIAGGIETEEERRTISELEIDYGQGVPAGKAREHLRLPRANRDRAWRSRRNRLQKRAASERDSFDSVAASSA